MNELMTKVIVEQPRLHCGSFKYAPKTKNKGQNQLKYTNNKKGNPKPKNLTSPSEFGYVVPKCPCLRSRRCAKPHLWPAAGPPPCSRGRRCRRSRKATAIAGDGGGGGDGNIELEEWTEGDLLELLESIHCDCITVAGT